MSSIYQHRPLSRSRCIRLLECKQRQDGAATLAEFDFQLLEASLDGNTPFYALSYVWGEIIPSESIICEKDKMPITTNCEAALRHILPRIKSCNIWIDSICINQSCALERNQQVALIREIYSKAEKVLI